MHDTRGSKILIVDDEPRNRLLLCKILDREGYQYEEAKDGPDAISKTGYYDPDLILLDVMMPGMDGFEVAKQLKSNPATDKIPIIMVTSLGDQASRVKGLVQGVEEFITKPVNANELQVRVRNLLRLKLAADVLLNHNEILEKEVGLRTGELQQSFEEGLQLLMRAAEYRDDETGSHVRRICHYTKALAAGLGMAPEFCETIFFASAMHDIGKIGIPDHILLKPGRFEPDEWEIMKTHASIGAEIMGSAKSPYMSMGKDIAMQHHERWDGSGYPQGLKEDDIALSARIMAICDVYDALRSHRPYKEPFEHEKSLHIIRFGDERVSPGQFDPDVRDAFVSAAEDFREIFESMKQ